jgi:hypothetical protein
MGSVTQFLLSFDEMFELRLSFAPNEKHGSPPPSNLFLRGAEYREGEEGPLVYIVIRCRLPVACCSLVSHPLTPKDWSGQNGR